MSVAATAAVTFPSAAALSIRVLAAVVSWATRASRLFPGVAFAWRMEAIRAELAGVAVHAVDRPGEHPRVPAEERLGTLLLQNDFRCGHGGTSERPV